MVGGIARRLKIFCEVKVSVNSMTGYSHLQVPTLLGELFIEIKSVNSRYKEISIKLPEELRFLEGEIRNILTNSVIRGKLDCRLQWVSEAVREQSLNQKMVLNLFALQNEIIKQYPRVTPLSVSQILAFPGVLEPKDVDFDSVKDEVLAGLNQCVEYFLQARTREGSELTIVINDYCNQVVDIVNALRPKIPLIVEKIQDKLKVRLEESLAKGLGEKSTLSEEEVVDRIRQEVILYAIKLDVDEEINRILTHIKEVRRLLACGGDIGKKLDFMMQELNREANTLGSKAAAIEMTQTSLTLKINIEKMREQIQNLE